MAALSFKSRFAPFIREGSKTQTIRAFRKIPIRPFEHLYLYTAMRTKYCKKIGEAQCLGTAMITIRKRSYIIHSIIDIKCTSKKDLDEFAILDGFTSWAELMKFWIEEHGPTCFPFTGTIIYFNLLSKKHWKKPGTHTKFRKLLKEQFHG